MKSRYFSNILKKNKNLLLKTAGAATLSTVGYITYKNISQKSKNLQEAYDKFSKQIQSRTSHHQIQSLFSEHCKTRYYESKSAVIKEQKSIEITTLLDATYYESPSIYHEDGSRSELNALLSCSWEEFIKNASDNIYISFGHRKAFDATNPLTFTHAILYVSDSKGHHAIFGYSSQQKDFIINDAANTTVSRHYTLYADLTIKGNKEQTKELFERIKQYSLQQYTFITCNCYSPLISGLLESKDIGFSGPDHYNDSLLIVIPSEQNYGMGITSNQYLKPLSENAVLRTQKLFKHLQHQANQTVEKVVSSFRNLF